MANFRKESPKFDGVNFDRWKEKMKTHKLCLGPSYWLITKNEKTIIEEDNLEAGTKDELDLFMCNIIAREALPENEYSQVRCLKTSHAI